MTRTYFGSSANVDENQLPYYNEWYDSLSKEQKSFYEGKVFLVKELVYAKSSGKGYLVKTYHFTTFMFKSHPFVKMLTEAKNLKALEGKCLCVEVNSKQKWNYQYCLEIYPAHFKGKLDETIVMESSNRPPSERDIIGYDLPSVPSQLPESSSFDEALQEILAEQSSNGQRAREGTGKGKKVV